MFAPHSLCFTWKSIISIGRVYYDLEAESSGWLFKSLLAGGVGILSAAPQALQLVVIKLLVHRNYKRNGCYVIMTLL